MQVSLISWTPSPEFITAAAARLCYRNISAAEILSNLSPDDINSTLDHVLSSGHLSVVEHTTFTFAVDGVSRVLTHQLVRHRVGVAFSQQSQRYAVVDEEPYVTPRTISSSAGHDEDFQALAAAAISLYRRLLAAGVPYEDARYVLPQAISTRLVMTANLRALMNMYRLDACLRSQWELRYLMTSIKREMRTVSPRFAQELRIKCFADGYCDEATMCDELANKMPRKQDVLQSHEAFTNTLYRRLAISVGEEEES